MAPNTMIGALSPTTGRIVQNDGTMHLIDLNMSTCSCGRYQENKVPCGHTIAFIYKQKLQLAAYLPARFSAETWAATYAIPMPAIDVANLELAGGCNAPLTRILRGRPRKKRLDRKDYRARRGLREEDMGEDGMVFEDNNRAHRCSTGGETGYNSAICRKPHS